MYHATPAVSWSHDHHVHWDHANDGSDVAHMYGWTAVEFVMLGGVFLLAILWPLERRRQLEVNGELNKNDDDSDV